MLVSFSIFSAGVLTVAVSLLGFGLMRRLAPENVFPEKRPHWLTGFAWAYLTFAVSAWIGFFQNQAAMPLLAAGICSLAAAKFLFVFFTYSDFRHIGFALWKTRRAFTVILISSIFVGGLMMFVAKLI